MSVFSEYFLVLLLSMSLVLPFLIYFLYFQYCCTYWRKKGVPTLEPKFPFGDVTSSFLGKESIFARITFLYKQFREKGHPFGGIYLFHGPIFMPVDVTIVKHILQVDFDHFVDRGVHSDRENMPISYHLFTMEGQEWKSLRAKMSPSFSSGKIKMMYDTMYDNAIKLVEKFEILSKTEEEINLKDIFKRFTINIICSTALGIEASAFNQKHCEFVDTADRFFNNTVWDFVKLLIQEGPTNFGAVTKLVHKDPRNYEFLSNVAKETIEYRLKNGIRRNDFMDLLIDMHNDKIISFQEIVSQLFLFFFAAYETSSSAMAYFLHELAHHQSIQDKLRKEITTVLGKNLEKLTYEEVMNLPYLDNVFRETMRKYPALPVINRICVKDYTIPDTNITITKGTPVFIPVLGLHMDPEYFEKPDEFNPDRFREKTYPTYSYLPFGEGPRNCVGKRYGLLQTKLGLVCLIAKFKFHPSKTTPKELTLQPVTTALIHRTKEEIMCTLTRLDSE